MPAPHAIAENHFQTHDGVSLFYRHRPALGTARIGGMLPDHQRDQQHNPSGKTE